VVRVRGAGGGRVSIAGVACYRPGDRPHLFYRLRVYRRRKGEAKGFTWACIMSSAWCRKSDVIVVRTVVSAQLARSAI
jgi:hypothetical protein